MAIRERRDLEIDDFRTGAGKALKAAIKLVGEANLDGMVQESLAQEALSKFIDDIQISLGDTHDALSQAYFKR